MEKKFEELESKYDEFMAVWEDLVIDMDLYLDKVVPAENETAKHSYANIARTLATLKAVEWFD